MIFFSTFFKWWSFGPFSDERRFVIFPLNIECFQTFLLAICVVSEYPSRDMIRSRNEKKLREKSGFYKDFFATLFSADLSVYLGFICLHFLRNRWVVILFICKYDIYHSHEISIFLKIKTNVKTPLVSSKRKLSKNVDTLCFSVWSRLRSLIFWGS